MYLVMRSFKKPSLDPTETYVAFREVYFRTAILSEAEKMLKQAQERDRYSCWHYWLEEET